MDDDYEERGFYPLTIKLIDHTIIPSENSPGIWARSAKVVDYLIISGSRTRAGAYVAWNCSIETFEGAQFTVRKRCTIDSTPLRPFGSIILGVSDWKKIGTPSLSSCGICLSRHSQDQGCLYQLCRQKVLFPSSVQNFLRPVVRACHTSSHVFF